MSIIPSRLQDKLDFFDLHAPVWSLHAAAIGITPTRASAFATLAAAARTNYNKQLAALSDLRVAVNQQQEAVADARTAASDIIRSVKAFAEASADPQAVYDLAQIPAPSAPSTAPPPGRPTDLSVTLDANSGDLTLRWKVTNPPNTAGTSYIVRRKLPGQSEWTFVGVTGSKKFIDTTFAAGPDSVQYTVQGQRSDASGPASEIFTVNFGRVGPGLVGISSVTHGEGPENVKIAA